MSVLSFIEVRDRANVEYLASEDQFVVTCSNAVECTFCRYDMITLEQSIAILQTLYVDVMFGEELPFLIGVSKPMNLITIEKLKNRTANFIELVMYNFVDTCRSNSFEVERSELFATMNQLWRVH